MKGVESRKRVNILHRFFIVHIIQNEIACGAKNEMKQTNYYCFFFKETVSLCIFFNY